MAKASEWVCRRTVWMSMEPVLPGVWKHRDGGHCIRGEARCSRSGKVREVFRVLPDADALTAAHVRKQMLDAIRAGQPPGAPPTRLSFKSYALQLFQARTAKGDIKSAATRELWEGTLRLRLYKAPFASFFVDEIRRADIEDWTERTVAPLINNGTISPHTANSWVRILKTIMNAAVAKYELERNPVAGLPFFDARGRRTVTVEQPNCLEPDELAPFLAEMKKRYPHHYAFTLLGFLTGLRPSSLRPLRREADVLWDDGAIIVRASHTRGVEVMDCTKTDEDQSIGLPPEVMDVLRWHANRLPFRLQASPLLFPGYRGTHLSSTFLTRPFADVCKALGVKKRITAKGMRRTAINLQRRAELEKRLRLAISGHKTEEARRLYEMVPAAETRQALAKVIDLIEYRKAVGG